jgi:soluble lytic murein transglycosylase-like protein
MRIIFLLKSVSITLNTVLGFWAFISLVFIFAPVALAANASAVEVRIATLGKGTTTQHQARQTRKLASYIQEQFAVTEDRAAIIVAEAIRRSAEHDDLYPELILAIIAVESTFKEEAVSASGAQGLMQIMARFHPEKVAAIGGAQALFDPQKNISTGSKILIDYLDASNGNLRQALLRYNGSLAKPTSRYPDKVLRIYNKMRRVTELS